MKSIFLQLVIIFLVTGCYSDPPSFNQGMEEMRDSFKAKAKVYNKKVLDRERLIDSLNNMADTNQTLALIAIDNIIKNRKSTLDKSDIEDLHFIKGNAYCKMDSFQNALEEYSNYCNGPKYLAARAGTLIKLKRFDEARTDLNEAARENYDYWWNLGNYYEVVGEKDSAMIYYSALYLKDTTYYKFCYKRMIELRNLKTKPLDELIFRDRGKPVMLLLK